MDLTKFLKDRHIEQETIQKLEDEKIDASVIGILPTEELSKFFPKLGDRVAVVEFCRKISSRRKEGILERIRRKIGKNEANSNSDTSSDELVSHIQKKKKVQSFRQVEIGFICDEKLIRTKQGGGTRKLKIEKKAKKLDIQMVALDVFFPEGISPLGSTEEFEFDIKDFKRQEIDSDFTIQQMFQLTKLSRLRLYLDAKRIGKEETYDCKGNPNLMKNKVIKNQANLRIEQQIEKELEKELTQIETTVEDIKKRGNEKGFFNIKSSETEDNLCEETIIIHIQNENEMVDSILQNECSNEEIGLTDEHFTQQNFRVQEHTSENNGNTSLVFETEFNGKSNNDVIFLAVHRGQVMKELIDAFLTIDLQTNPIINIEMLGTNGELEGGVDVGGVFRDALSEFWRTFYDTCTVGSQYKVPFIRDDYDEERWQAVAKIIEIGWTNLKYFPIKLAPVFMECCLYGNVMSNVKDDFIKFLSENEYSVIKTSMENWNDDSFDEVLDILGTLDCKRLPTKDNIDLLVRDIAHKELIQKPTFVIDAWSKIIKNLLDFKTLKTIYKDRIASADNVLKVLRPLEHGSQQEKVFQFLKKFIRQSDNQQLSNLVRFCTGADLLTESLIYISFNKTCGLNRRPIGHTCGCTLELPLSYENYVDFRSEMNSILKSDMWTMDIV